MENWIEKFIKELAEIIDKPPYLIFMFVSAVLLMVSILTGRYFDQIFVIFVFSMAGSVWRYIEKDLDGGVSKVIYNSSEGEKRRSPGAHFGIIIIYHLGNILLLLSLISRLKLIS